MTEALFLTIIAVTYIYLIKYIAKQTIKKIIRSSFGYVRNIEYKSFNYFTLTLHGVKFHIKSSNLSSLLIPHIILRFGFRKLIIKMSDVLFVDGNESVRLMNFKEQPIFEYYFREGFFELLSKSIRVNILNNNNDKIIKGTVYIDDFLIKNHRRRNSFESILKYHYQTNDTSHKVMLDFVLGFGISARNNSRYMKSLKIKKAGIILPDCSIKTKGKLEFRHFEGPLGSLIFDIKNAIALPSSLFSKHEILENNVGNFIKYMQKIEKSQNLKINVEYTDTDVLINGLPLSEVKIAS